MEIIPFNNSTHSQKMSMLYDLFPDHMPSFIEYVKNMAITIQESPEIQIRHWNNPFFNFSTWLTIIQTVQTNLIRFDKARDKDGIQFTKLFYSDHQFYFMDYCIMSYTTYSQPSNLKFKQAVQLFFGE